MVPGIVNHLKRVFTGKENFWLVFFIWVVILNVAWVSLYLKYAHIMSSRELAALIGLLGIVFSIGSLFLLRKNTGNTIGKFVLGLILVVIIAWVLIGGLLSWKVGCTGGNAKQHYPHICK